MSRIQHVFGKALVGAALALSVALPLGAAATGLPRDVIYNFTCGPEGAISYAGLIRDAAGNFYGTTTGAFCPGGGSALSSSSPRSARRPRSTSSRAEATADYPEAN
jgi:hypothetical protein